MCFDTCPSHETCLAYSFDICNIMGYQSFNPCCRAHHQCVITLVVPQNRIKILRLAIGYLLIAVVVSLVFKTIIGYLLILKYDGNADQDFALVERQCSG